MSKQLIQLEHQAAAYEGGQMISEEIPETRYEEESKNDENKFNICGKALECGHSCRGVAGEFQCLPCLNLTCIEE